MTSARTLIMLICMIALPVCALLGSGWTRYLDFGSQPDQKRPAGNLGRGSSTGATPQTGLAEMIRARDRQTAGRRADGLPVAGQPREIQPAATARPLAQQTSEMRGANAQANVAASFEAAGASSPRATIVRAGPSDEPPMDLPRPPAPVRSPRRAAAEGAMQDGQALEPAHLGNERSSRPAGVQPFERPRDWFSAVTQRLRDLGATYYLLETWGRNGELYRFHCKMAVAGSNSYTRHFEATNADAAMAMRLVLEQVETWRSARGR